MKKYNSEEWEKRLEFDVRVAGLKREVEYKIKDKRWRIFDYLLALGILISIHIPILGLPVSLGIIILGRYMQLTDGR